MAQKYRINDILFNQIFGELPKDTSESIKDILFDLIEQEPENENALQIDASVSDIEEIFSKRNNLSIYNEY